MKKSPSHEDKHQVVGEGREGNQHEWNRFDQVSANLQTKMDSVRDEADTEAAQIMKKGLTW